MGSDNLWSLGEKSGERQAWYAGIYTGDDYDYRRDWIERLLEYQAGVFAVDVVGRGV